MAESIVGLTVRKWCSAGGFYILGYFDLKKKNMYFHYYTFFLVLQRLIMEMVEIRKIPPKIGKQI